MKDIIWDKLSGFDRFIFLFGWLAAMQVGFWIILVVIYLINKDKKGCRDFFNPTTLKVPYIFGWVNLIILSLVLVAGLFFLLIVLPVSVTRMLN